MKSRMCDREVFLVIDGPRDPQELQEIHLQCRLLSLLVYDVSH
jgi:hypothetical protein